MFRAILMTQWKWAREGLVVCIIVAALLPLVGVWVLDARDLREYDVRLLLIRLQAIGAAYAILAFAVGAMLAGTAWNADSSGQYVYAMSLPVPRWTFVMLRFGAGAVLVLLPTLAVLAGALATIQAVTLPATLHSYSLALTTRFLLATLLSFALWFGMLVRGKVAVLWLVGSVVVISVLVLAMAELGGGRILGTVQEVLVGNGGILGVYTGRWMLIDV